MHDDHPMLQPYTMNDRFRVENSCYQVLTQNVLQGERDGWRVGRDKQALDKAAGNGHYLPLLLLEGSFVGSFAGGVAEEEAPSAEDLPAAADLAEDKRQKKNSETTLFIIIANSRPNFNEPYNTDMKRN